MKTFRLFPVGVRGNTPDFMAYEKRLYPDDVFTAVVGGERLVVPYRVYADYTKNLYAGHADLQQIAAACFFSRHHNGRVREECLRFLLHSTNMRDFAVPYIFKLAEEYVVELAEIILKNFSMAPRRTLEDFARENPQWTRLMRQRSVSYWNCYYRHRYARLEDYPGIILSDMLREIAAS